MTTSLNQHGFAHVYEPGQPGVPPVLLLHATGGNEQDLVPLTHFLAPGSPLLSVRGKVLENGKARYFNRFAQGVFDLEDLHFRTQELFAFVNDSLGQYGIERGRLVILGYSNGANIGTNLIFSYPDTFAGGVFIRPTPTHVRSAPYPDLSGKRILLLGAQADKVVPAGSIPQLADQFAAASADVTALTHPDAGHGLCQADFEAITPFLSQFARQ